MTHILMVYEGTTSTAELMRGFLGTYVKEKRCKVTFVPLHEVNEAVISNSDVVVSIRGESPLMHEVMKQARKAGRFIIAQLDDDLQHLPKAAFRYPGHKKYLLKCLRQAHVFLTTNQLLAEEYCPLIGGDRAVVADTGVAPEEILPRVFKEETEVVRIVYAASSAHVTHWNQYVAPIWNQLAEKYGERISLTFVGMKPEVPVGNVHTKVELIPPMSLKDYRAYMYSQRFDIGLSPLTPDHFNERKYYNKFIEYTMCGVCGVYSDCAPYNLIVRDGVNGILVGNSTQDWLKALVRIIEDKQLRENCIKTAQSQLRQDFSTERIQKCLVDDIPEFLNYSAPQNCKFRISLFAKIEQGVFRLIERGYLFVISMKWYGWKATLERIGKKLKK